MTFWDILGITIVISIMVMVASGLVMLLALPWISP